MKIEVFWSEEEGVMLILAHDVVLWNAESVGQFKEAIVPTLRARNQKVPLVICMDGMTIRPSAAQLYGAAAKEIVSYATAFARYGKAGTVQMVIAAEAMRNHQHPNIFDTRAAAVGFVRAAAAKNGCR